jgi:hypothetical protein
MTMEQYYIVVQAMVGLDVCEVLLTGGEPLIHPQFSQLLWRLHNDFPKADLLLQTNGSHLNLLSHSERGLFKQIAMSFYGEFNQDIVNKVIEEPLQYPNVFLSDCRHFDDPDIDPRLDEEQARYCHILCCHRCVRILGTRVYGCCIAEAIERHYGTEKVHMELRPGWYEEFKSLPTYKVCQRCSVAARLIQSSAARHKARVFKFLLNNPVAVPAVTAYRLAKRSVMRRRLWHCVGSTSGTQNGSPAI